jgi:transcriptional regulator with XRE-family HTH domain
MMTHTQIVPITGSGVGGLEIQQAGTGSSGPIAASIMAFVCAALLALPAQSTSTIDGQDALSRSLPSGMSAAVVEQRRPFAPSHASHVWNVVASNQSPADQVREIRNAFTLTMQQVADLMGVTRPVIYRWRDGRAAPRVKHRVRLASLARIATQWLAMNRSILPLSLQTVRGRRPSVFELLSQNPLPEAAIAQELDDLASARNRQPPHPSLDELFARRGVSPRGTGISTVDRELRSLSLSRVTTPPAGE